MAAWTAPAPEGPTYVIGDVHGCVDQLGNLLEQIDDDIAERGNGHGQVVFVGDYVDRGPSSAEVLRFVAQITQDYPEWLIGLMGNHERMLLDFINDPTGRAKRWLRYGGLQTLANFGVSGGLTTDTRAAGQLLDAAGDLREALGKSMVEWLSNLPKHWNSGSLWVVHAGADPTLPMTNQPEKTLLWGSEKFLSQDRSDGQWVAFGHQPFEEPFALAGRIGVDTGAVYGGKLTAARIDPDGSVGFLAA